MVVPMANTRDDGSDMSSGVGSYDYVSLGNHNDFRGDYPGSADFQSDDLHSEDFLSEAFLSEDFRTEDFHGDDFHSVPEAPAANVSRNLNTGEADLGVSTTNLRSTGFEGGEATQFFQSMDFDDNSDFTQGPNARGSSASTGAYGSNFQSTLSALPDLAASDNDLVSSYNQSGAIAWPMVGPNILGHALGIDEVSSYGDFVPRPPFTSQALPGWDPRWAEDNQPWNPLYPSGVRETTLSSDYTEADPERSSTTYSASAFTPSESDPSSSSYDAGAGTSNTSADVYGQYMAESQATLRPQDHDPGLRSNNESAFANTTRWETRERSGVVNHVPAYSHVGAQMRETTSRRFV